MLSWTLRSKTTCAEQGVQHSLPSRAGRFSIRVRSREIKSQDAGELLVGWLAGWLGTKSPSPRRRARRRASLAGKGQLRPPAYVTYSIRPTRQMGKKGTGTANQRKMHLPALPRSLASHRSLLISDDTPQSPALPVLTLLVAAV